MRYLVKAATLVVLLALLAPDKLLAAGDYISDATAALQHASVYVAPGTEGTDKDTAGRLQTRLKNDDNIVLIMLPSAAESELGVDPQTIATRLSEELENKRIIGLAVGNNVVGYAPTLPAGVAADKMRRARSVSNDPITALGTFAQNMHTWQAENPTPQPSPLESVKNGGLSWFWWLVIVIPVSLLVIGAVIGVVKSSVTETNENRTHFKAPDQVKDLLATIARKREQIRDVELNKTLLQMCLDIERYFGASSKDKKRDSVFFKQRLTEVSEVLTKYIEIQQAPRYYENPEAELIRGKSSITDFARYVLDSIRRGHAVDLLDYKVNTNILQAQSSR